MVNNNRSAARGEKGLSSLQSSEAALGGKMGEASAETQAPAAAAASWDPYQVWLTRVKQPREQSARRASRPAAVDSAKSTDLSETARLQALRAAVPR